MVGSFCPSSDGLCENQVIQHSNTEGFASVI